MRIRDELPSDAAAIEAVTLAAFAEAPHSNHAEHLVVRELRRSGALSVSLVAEDDDGAVVGHVAASPVTVSCGAKGWHGLGPVSVVPGRQRAGVGTRLVGQALNELRAAGADGCVVLGEPAFYSRFGFAAQPSLVLPGVPAEYFQALSFDGPPASGTVAYHAAFAAGARETRV